MYLHLHTRCFFGEVLCDGVFAILLVDLGRGLALLVTDCDITACFHKCANSVHIVVISGDDERGIPLLVSDVNIALIPEEQHHDLRVFECLMKGRPVQRSHPTPFLPIDRCPVRNESLGFCLLRVLTGIIKCLVDVQSTSQGAVSACSRATSAASYLCFGTRSRGRPAPVAMRTLPSLSRLLVLNIRRNFIMMPVKVGS